VPCHSENAQTRLQLSKRSPNLMRRCRCKCRRRCLLGLVGARACRDHQIFLFLPCLAESCVVLSRTNTADPGSWLSSEMPIFHPSPSSPSPSSDSDHGRPLNGWALHHRTPPPRALVPPLLATHLNVCTLCSSSMQRPRHLRLIVTLVKPHEAWRTTFYVASEVFLQGWKLVQVFSLTLRRANLSSPKSSPNHTY
jgi:hypothetical protein